MATPTESIERRSGIPGRRQTDHEFSRSMGYNGDMDPGGRASVMPLDQPDLMTWNQFLFDLVDATVRQVRRFNEVILGSVADFLSVGPVNARAITGHTPTIDEDELQYVADEVVTRLMPMLRSLEHSHEEQPQRPKDKQK